jgi:putative ABC transport system permease protein
MATTEGSLSPVHISQETPGQRPALPVAPLRVLYRGLGVCALAVRRLAHRPGLTLLAFLGIVLAISLVSSAGFFAQAVDRVVIGQELGRLADITGRPAFSMRVYAFTTARQPLSLQRTEALAHVVNNALSTELRLPRQSSHVMVSSGAAPLMSKPGAYGGEPRFLGAAPIVYSEGIEEKLAFTGAPMADGRSGDLLDVWMSASMSDKLGVQLGDEFSLGLGPEGQPLHLKVRGFWATLDRQDPYWFSSPDMTLGDALLVRRQDYLERVQPLVFGGARAADWYIILDESQLSPARARDYIEGLDRALVEIRRHAPDARLDMSALQPLERFVERNRALTILLLGFNLPALGFLLYFLLLIGLIIARWQRRDSAILASRGMSTATIIGLTLAESLLLLAPAIPLGILAGMGLARLMGYASSFLEFTAREPLPVSLQGVNLPLIAATAAVVVATRLIPAATAARDSTVEEEREHARASRKPFWYRYYLDFLLILPTAYAYQQLRNRGSLALLAQEDAADLYRDPLLVLVPALFILTAALLAMRLFPLLARLLDWLAGAVPWIAPHLALRQLSRRSESYINPLLLIIVCLALGVYTLSEAASLDRWLADRMYYRVGADVAFTPALMQAGGGGMSSSTPDESQLWALPISDYVDLPGVADGTPVGEYPAEAVIGSNRVRLRFMGIERLSFPRVAWFRRDLADERLGGLMNLLAANPNGILIPESALAKTSLRVGDVVNIRVMLADDLPFDGQFTIAGTFRNFPTVYPEKPDGLEGLSVVGNLDYLFAETGQEMSHAVWLRMEPGADGEAVFEELRRRGIEPGRSGDAPRLIAEEQAQPERVGVFGVLTVGFLAAALMAFVGLLINTYASLHDRLYQFAVLRAVGLPNRQVLVQVTVEYLLLVAYGTIAGAFIGLWTSRLLMPFFRVTRAQEALLPEIIPVIAQAQVTRLAVAFAVALILLEVLVIAAALRRRFIQMLSFGGLG